MNVFKKHQYSNYSKSLAGSEDDLTYLEKELFLFTMNILYVLIYVTVYMLMNESHQDSFFQIMAL